MSDSPNEERAAQSAANEGNTDSGPQDAAPVKQRSTAEKIIVRTLIVALVVFATVEARARFGYERTLAAVKDVFEGDENKKETTLSELESSFWFFPSREESDEPGNRTIKLHWFSFVYKGKYEISLTVGRNDDDPSVLSFMTPDAERPEMTVVSKPGGEDGEGAPDPGEPGAVGPTPSAVSVGGAKKKKKGRKKRDPQAFINGLMENDKNKDGKLSKDEWPDNRKEMLERADADKDGTVTKDELTKAVENFRRGAGKKKKKQRPEAEDTSKKAPSKPEVKEAPKPENKTTPKGETKKEKKD